MKEVCFGFLIGMSLALNFAVWLTHRTAHITPGEARALVIQCEKALPRNQECKLIAVPAPIKPVK